MITNISIGLDGRLGNQLFQYAALKSLALHNNYQCVLPNLTERVWHGQQCLLDNFNLECDFVDKLSLEWEYNEENINEFDSNFFNIPDKTTIRGFFQNLKYFENFENQICKELTTKQNIQDIADNLLEFHRGDHELVSIHIRRGDNVTVNVEFGNQLFGNDSSTLDWSTGYGLYLKKALSLFDNKKVKFLVFTGGSRTSKDNSDDIKWIENNLKFDNISVLSTDDPLVDYTLISKCDHNILSHATSFGWWAAYINQNLNKIMIAPKNYFVDGSDASRMFTNKFILL